jgi:hypothetical protein
VTDPGDIDTVTRQLENAATTAHQCRKVLPNADSPLPRGAAHADPGITQTIRFSCRAHRHRRFSERGGNCSRRFPTPPPTAMAVA